MLEKFKTMGDIPRDVVITRLYSSKTDDGIFRLKMNKDRLQALQYYRDLRGAEDASWAKKGRWSKRDSKLQCLKLLMGSTKALCVLTLLTVTLYLPIHTPTDESGEEPAYSPRTQNNLCLLCPRDPGSISDTGALAYLMRLSRQWASPVPRKKLFWRFISTLCQIKCRQIQNTTKTHTSTLCLCARPLDRDSKI